MRDLMARLLREIDESNPTVAYLAAKELIDAQCRAFHLTKRDHLATLSGVFTVAGWAAGKLGEEAEARIQGSGYCHFQEARGFLERAFMTGLYPSMGRLDYMLELSDAVNGYLDEVEYAELRRGMLSGSSIDLLSRIGRKERSYKHYQLLLRLDQAEDPTRIGMRISAAEQAGLLIRMGQSFLDMNLAHDGGTGKDIPPEELACSYWRKVLVMERAREEIYPTQILLAIFGLLGSEPNITVARVKKLYEKAQSLVELRKEKEELELMYAAAMRRTDGPETRDLKHLLDHV